VSLKTQHLAIVALLAAIGSGACASKPSDRVAHDVTIVREERTPDKLVARGMAFAGVGDLVRAEQYLAAALDAGADPNLVLPKLLRVCITSGNHLAAINYATPLLQQHPDDAHLRFVVAELRVVTGDTQGARADLSQVVEQTPDDPAPHFAYAHLLRDKIGDPVAADRELRAYLRLAPEGEHAEEARASLLKVVAVQDAKVAPPALAVPAISSKKVKR
jgi:Flp pilus assembly protein TadD